MNALESQIFTVKIKPVNENNRTINWGGCGLFAMALVKHLRRMGYSPTLVLIDYSPNQYKDYMEEYGYIPAFAPKPSHVMVKLNKYYIDSTGAYSPRRFRKTKWYSRGEYHITPENYKPAIFTNDGWNNDFKRCYSAFKDIIVHIKSSCDAVKKLDISVLEQESVQQRFLNFFNKKFSTVK